MNEVTLKEFLEEKFRHQESRLEATNRRLDQLTMAIEKLAETTVSIKKFESTCHRVGELQQAIRDMDQRLDKAENYIGIWRYLGAGAVTVILAILIAWLKVSLGL